MYRGYLIKIGTTSIDNSLLSKESYSFTKEKRVIEEYFSGDGSHHVVYGQKDKVTVAFTTKYLPIADVKGILDLLTDNEISATCFNAMSNDYSSVTLETPKSIEPKIHRAYGSTILCKPITIKMEGYVDA